MHVVVRCLLLALAWAPMLMAAEPGDIDPAGQVEAAADAGPDRLELDSTSIRGNQELPRVLYIVPWKDPALGDLAGRPANSLVEEALAPVDREVFLRQTRYFDQLYGADSADGP